MKEMEKTRSACLKRLEELTQLQKRVEKSLRKAPEGTLILSGTNGTTQYYQKTQNTEKQGRYIKKKERRLIAALAQKDYDLKFLKALEKQKSQLDKILQLLPQTQLEDVFSSLSVPRQQLVKPHVLSDEEYVEQWLNVEYTGKEFPEEYTMHQTERGEMVRSKSEKILADKMYALGIPYRYEYPLWLRGYGTIYPDFTILKISTREEIYLEHFGMMDDPQYCQKAMLKLQTYARNHIYPGHGLLLTFETQQTSLDMKAVEEMLKEVIC